MEYTSKAQLVTQMKINLETRNDVRVRALLRIFENQTFDEQDAVLRRKIVKYAAQLVNGSINEGKIRYVDGKYIW